MDKLDTNALINIAKTMNIKDLLSLCQTSKQMKKVCDTRLLWRHSNYFLKLIFIKNKNL